MIQSLILPLPHRTPLRDETAACLLGPLLTSHGFHEAKLEALSVLSERLEFQRQDDAVAVENMNGWTKHFEDFLFP